MQSLELSRKLEGVSKTSIRGTLRSLSWKAVCGESRLPRLEGEQGHTHQLNEKMNGFSQRGKGKGESGKSLFVS